MYGELPEIKTEAGVVHGFPVVIPNPPKTALLRLPTTEEAMEWLSQQKSVARSTSRGSETDINVTAAHGIKSDAAFFKKLRLDSGEEFDDSEASAVVDQLTKQRVAACDLEGDGYAITLLTRFGKTIHHMRKPFLKDIMEYRRRSYAPRNLGHGVEERRFPPDAAVALYDKSLNSVEGYAPGTDVPPFHKTTVIIELTGAIDRELDPDLDPNF